MPDGSALLLFAGATLALNLTPGPDMLYVVARSVGEGRAAGVASALGIAVGCLVHTLLVALGLAQLLVAVPAAYDVVRFGGAAYLVYLGIRAILARPAADAEAPPRASRGAIFRQGIVTNILNPKVALFFLAFLPQFVDAGRGSVAVQLLVLGLLFNTSGTLVNLGVAWAASGAGRWTAERVGPSPLLQRVTGAVFIALGVRIAFAGRS